MKSGTYGPAASAMIACATNRRARRFETGGAWRGLPGLPRLNRVATFGKGIAEHHRKHRSLMRHVTRRAQGTRSESHIFRPRHMDEGCGPLDWEGHRFTP